LGALQFFLIERAPDFLHDDVGFFDRADSLLHRAYVTEFDQERVQPPGFPVILALLCATVSCTHDSLLRAMPVFLTLGFLLSYEVIRCQRGRPVAAASCLLLASSPSLFVWVSSRLWPSYPYFFISSLVLFLTPKLETPMSPVRRTLGVALLSLLVTAAVMVQSAGIALIGALLGWAFLSFLQDSLVAKARLKVVVPIVLVALLAQTWWLHQGSNTRVWPLPGRGESYLSQLKVKSGNYPELGMASPRDIRIRVENNLKDRTLYLGEVFVRHWISSSWASIGVAVPILLILFGICSSLLSADSQLCALYFVGYECIYLLWPWSFETPRFMLPVLPLACLYLAEGVVALRWWSQQYPRRVGAAFLPLTVVSTLVAARQGWVAHPGYGFQDKISAILWIISATICSRLIWKGSLPPLNLLAGTSSFCSKNFSAGRISFNLAQLVWALLLAGLVATNIAAEIPIGRKNLSPGQIKLENTPDIQAGLWIQTHTDPNAVIASRVVDLVQHYARRRVIWFPPITNPKILMQGMREHRIRYVVIIDRGFSYYLPAESVCFDILYTGYPEAFRLVEQRSNLRIYEVLPYSTALAR
jgi:hypothetical protein